ncbi:hypothetical protein [Gudongella sp. DL1XJH-153]|uniref:hypothetical protein n=1 Tax=Gudongella sp. DL1XJH-153 TaxID=3409804 RepID=UPI003BB6E702
MIKTKLILIDGITGSGKSTTAQFLAGQLRLNGIKAKWYHETEDSHPLAYEEDVEVFSSNQERDKFLKTIPKLWRKFSKDAEISDHVHIIESHLLQDTVRILFQNNLDETRISTFVKEIEDIIEPLNPALLYFKQMDVEHSIRKVWKRRGEDWKNWFVDSDIQTPFVKSSGIIGETGVIKLWAEYQNFTDKIFEGYGFKKLCIDNSEGNWTTYHQQMMKFLSLNLISETVDVNIDEKRILCGTYKEKEGDLSCSVKLLDENLVCDLIWPDIRVLPDATRKNLFYLESFPINIEFIENKDGSVESIHLSGSREAFDGKRLIRV